MSSNLIKLASKRAEMQVTKTCTATTRESIGRKGSANLRQSKAKQSLVFFGKQLQCAWAIKDENHEDYAAERFEYLKLCPNLPNRFYSTHTKVKRKRRRGNKISLTRQQEKLIRRSYLSKPILSWYAQWRGLTALLHKDAQDAHKTPMATMADSN